MKNLNSVQVSRVLHAGYIFECDQTRILFDPIFENPFSRNCYAFPPVQFNHQEIQKQKFQAVFISHFHDDHCSFESLKWLDRKTPIYIFCVFEKMLSLIRELGFENVISLKLSEKVDVGPFQVIPLEALDAEVDSIFHIKVAGLNILNVVDSWIGPETMNRLAETKKWDLVLWPFQTMREIEVLSPKRHQNSVVEIPGEWNDQLQALRPRYLVPSSCQFQQEPWSWYNHTLFPISYQEFAKAMQNILPKTEIIRMNPSTSIRLTAETLEKSESLSWIHPVGPQDVDYVYRPDLSPPTTSEISQRFEALTPSQLDLVQNFLKVGILEKYRSLDLPEDPYFRKPLNWRLSVYDHKGDVLHFDYRLKSSRIEIAASGSNLGWVTEVPAAKLYAALTLGESLTSMYLRINDVSFPPEIESIINDVDITEDPLIRCLFHDVFGSYQIAQLEKIKAAASPIG